MGVLFTRFVDIAAAWAKADSTNQNVTPPMPNIDQWWSDVCTSTRNRGFVYKKDDEDDDDQDDDEEAELPEGFAGEIVF